MRHNRVRCDQCEGTGRTYPDPYCDRHMRCDNGCDNGFFDAEPRDLDGKRGRVKWLTGVLFIWHGVLCLENDDLPGLVVPVDPLTVEILNG